MKKVTARKKERWVEHLDRLKSSYLSLYFDVKDHVLSDDEIESLANLTCHFDEAIADVERIPEGSR